MNNPIAPSAPATWRTSYKPVPGVYDELVDADGHVRDAWAPTIDAMESLGREELQNRWEQGQREITKNGIAYNPYDEAKGGSRPWLLDPIPLVLSEAEAERIGAGLRQWATLYDLTLRDLFGAQHLLRDKVLPPDVLYGQSRYYPAYHSAHEPTQTRIHLYAADLARAPDGQWWVTGNRTHAPFGLGYVLENRLMNSRLFPEAIRASNIYRVAPFFAALREALMSLAPRRRENPRIVLWSAGPAGDSYFEDAYLARYLGYTLAQGDDLTVRQDKVMLKTLGGLLPVEVLFRRLDDDACDSVELRSDAKHNIPGLLEVLRSGGVGLANGLGSSLAEAAIFSAHAPILCQELLSQDLILPTVATWWCGEEKEFEYVLEHFDELLLRPALGTADSPGIRAGELSKRDKEALILRVKAAPEQWVGQETVARSSTPAWQVHGPKAWRVALRAFAVASKDSYVSLQGGLARISADPNRLDPSIAYGERSQDVWVRAAGPVEELSLLPRPGESIELKRSGADLPSRVCDNLYWLGRNVERIENAVRLQRVAVKVASGEYDEGPTEEFLARAIASRDSASADLRAADGRHSLMELHAQFEKTLFDKNEPSSVPSLVLNTLRLASTVRDRIAVEMWRTVCRIDEAYATLERSRDRGGTVKLSRLDALLAEVSGFAGLASESMTRAEGWRFLDLGRRIERAVHTCMLLRSTLGVASKNEPILLELLLELADSIMTYRGRYLASIHPAPVLDLLLTDETNPRSVGFQLARIMEHVDAFPREPQRAVRTPEERISLSLMTAIRLADVQSLVETKPGAPREKLSRLLNKSTQQLLQLSDAITGHYLVHAGPPRHFGNTLEGSL